MATQEHEHADEYRLVNTQSDTSKDGFETWQDAHDELETVVKSFPELQPDDLQIEAVHSDGESDATQNGDSEDSDDTVEAPPQEEPPQQPTEPVENEPESNTTEIVTEESASGIERYDDPIPNLPGWMKEEVKEHGGMDLNKDGCQVIANALGFAVSAEPDVKAHETDFEYACYTATVERPDGRTFNAVGDCHIEEAHKSKKDLNRMAETRAKKRSVKWSTAGGIEPFISERSNE